MGQTKYKNILKFKRTPDPIERRKNLTKEVLKDSTPLPQPLEYSDIDAGFKDWVENELSIAFEGKEIPTVALFSNQRFSEYIETWNESDDQKNILMNFKVITRENNPQTGTLHNKNMNIPGDRFYLMKRVVTQDDNGRLYNIDYKMKQPFCVDLMYNLSLVTNKYQLLNEFNMMLNKKFKAIQCYIRPNGHYLPMKLESISDESEYSIDDRQYFSQSFQIKVMAYIIQKDDIVVEENPIMTFNFGEIDNKNKASVEIEEISSCDDPVNPYYYQPLEMRIVFHECETSVRFKLRTGFDFIITNYQVSPEINPDAPFKMRVNDTDVDNLTDYHIKDGSDIYIYSVNKYEKKEVGTITIWGYNPDVVFDDREDKQEVSMDNLNKGEEIDIN